MPADTTAAFYATNAQTYVESGGTYENPWRHRFLGFLTPGASILELGCGGGYDAEAMIAAGFNVTPTDGTPEIAAQAQARLGIPVNVLAFSDLEDVSRFDGIWANACLLHVPRTELPSIIKHIQIALRSGGVFYASYKAGENEGRDGLGRYYNYPSVEWLDALYGALEWENVTIEEANGSGYDRLPTRWLHVMAVKHRESAGS
jgi:SAM-dependent methyltransferase